MPELPDVEGFRRRFEALARGRVVERVHVDARGRMLLAPSRALVAALEGRRLAETARLGKWMFARVAGARGGKKGDWLVLHFGMTGDIEPVEEDVPPYARLVLRFRGGGGVAFTDPRRFGRIGLVESPEAFAREQELGPDAASIPVTEFLRRLETRRGAIKAALLDQSLLAGVGNLWADEALWQARIHPAARVQALDVAARRRFHRVMHGALRRALRKPGDYGALPRSWLLPSRRAGASCPRCGARLARGTVAGRTTFWCPKEQVR